MQYPGCTIINSFFNANIELYPDDVSHKEHTTEVLATLLFRDPKNGTGLFHLDLIILTLSSYYGQIHSAIVLSLAAVSPDVAYTHIC